jgi:hypothetical protein
VLTTLAFRRAASAISGGIPDQAAAVAGYQLAFQLAGLALAAGAALVLLMTDHPRRRPASLGRSHAARILLRFRTTPRT